MTTIRGWSEAAWVDQRLIGGWSDWSGEASRIDVRLGWFDLQIWIELGSVLNRVWEEGEMKRDGARLNDGFLVEGVWSKRDRESNSWSMAWSGVWFSFVDERTGLSASDHVERILISGRWTILFFKETRVLVFDWVALISCKSNIRDLEKKKREILFGTSPLNYIYNIRSPNPTHISILLTQFIYQYNSIHHIIHIFPNCCIC